MATVRIYKVAELLGTTSQEVSALLKRDHGIEVKSASSTIEEVVARQFVERAHAAGLLAPDGEGEWRRPTSEANRALRISATRAILMTGRQGRDPRNPVKSRPATCNRGRITA